MSKIYSYSYQVNEDHPANEIVDIVLLTDLQSLTLHGMPPDFSLEDLQCTNLTYLDLSEYFRGYSHNADQLFTFLKKLPHLTHLNLSNQQCVASIRNQIWKGLESWGELPFDLCLSDNIITPSLLRCLNPQLTTYLGLQNCRLRDNAFINELAHLTNTTHLDLSGNLFGKSFDISPLAQVLPLMPELCILNLPLHPYQGKIHLLEALLLCTSLNYLKMELKTAEEFTTMAKCVTALDLTQICIHSTNPKVSNLKPFLTALPETHSLRTLELQGIEMDEKEVKSNCCRA